MFRFSDSSSSSSGYHRTMTIMYREPGLTEKSETSEDYSSSSSSTSLLTPSSLCSVQSLLDKLDHEKEIEKYFGYHPIWSQMSLSDGQKLRTLEYFWEYKIFQLFNFLMTHLLAHTPDDPIPFLVSLIDRCIQYRDGDRGDPPLVFEEKHVRSVYSALDPLNDGSILYNQYLVGMNTLGLTEFNIMPDDLVEQRDVAKEVFVREAKQALLKQLDEMFSKDRIKERHDDEEFEKIIEYDKKTNPGSKGQCHISGVN